jgi:hypothetical protein
LLHGKLKYVEGLGAYFILLNKLTGNQLDSDIVFVKLVLSILAVSTFDYTFYTNTASINLENIKAVLCIQDMYIELAWRYLND